MMNTMRTKVNHNAHRHSVESTIVESALSATAYLKRKISEHSLDALLDHSHHLSNTHKHGGSATILRNKHHHRVHFGEAVVHEYPAAQSLVPAEDLWHDVDELHARFDDDLLQLRMANKYGSESLETTRGLESYEAGYENVKRSVKLYVQKTLKKTHSNKLILTKRSRAKRSRLDDNLATLTRVAQHSAYKRAAEDEQDAQAIYLEDPTSGITAVKAQSLLSSDMPLHIERQ